MAYFSAFLEGLLSFISPCVLPMIPLYIAYLAGSSISEESKNESSVSLVINSISFIIGFSIIFVALGASASYFGNYLNEHLDKLNRIGGFVLIIFSLSFLGLKFLPFLEKTYKPRMNVKSLSISSSLLFGIIFAIGWSPCTGPFLGFALMLAANSETLRQGVFTLLFYSMGLGIPFLLSAMFLNHLEGAFKLIKKHYTLVAIISGLLLLFMGIYMSLGYSPNQLFI